MTKDVVIGTVTGVVAVLAVAVLSPRAQTPGAGPVVAELASTGSSIYNGLGKSYLPATRPDPARTRLDKTLERFEAKGTPLDEVIQQLRDATGANLFVNWRALEAAGISHDAPVTLDLHGVSAAVVLKMVLKDAGGGNIRLGYEVADGVVTVSTLDDLSRNVYTRIYDVRALIEDEFAHRRRLAGESQKPIDETEVADALVRLIQQTIEPTSWRDAGGSVGAIRYFGGRLIIAHTLDGHDQILQLLAGLRLTVEPKQER